LPRHADPNAKDALVAAARAEFAKKGLRGARIEDITSACGLSKGAFYLHFPSKEALFGELVEAFTSAMHAQTDSRRRSLTDFLERHGPISRKDATQKTVRYRDLVGVLLRGAQGTRFEGFIWTITDGEVDRVQQDFTLFQGGSCRGDIPSEIIGSLVVGTYLLLAMRMSRMKEKPDLAAWSRSLHLLIREGSSPVDDSTAGRPRRLN
jgi:AcrR family transcriptional regulator